MKIYLALLVLLPPLLTGCFDHLPESTITNDIEQINFFNSSQPDMSVKLQCLVTDDMDNESWATISEDDVELYHSGVDQHIANLHFDIRDSWACRGASGTDTRVVLRVLEEEYDGAPWVVSPLATDETFDCYKDFYREVGPSGFYFQEECEVYSVSEVTLNVSEDLPIIPDSCPYYKWDDYHGGGGSRSAPSECNEWGAIPL